MQPGKASLNRAAERLDTDAMCAPKSLAHTNSWEKHGQPWEVEIQETAGGQLWTNLGRVEEN